MVSLLSQIPQEMWLLAVAQVQSELATPIKPLMLAYFRIYAPRDTSFLNEKDMQKSTNNKNKGIKSSYDELQILRDQWRSGSVSF